MAGGVPHECPQLLADLGNAPHLPLPQTPHLVAGGVPDVAFEFLLGTDGVQEGVVVEQDLALVRCLEVQVQQWWLYVVQFPQEVQLQSHRFVTNLNLFDSVE